MWRVVLLASVVTVWSSGRPALAAPMPLGTFAYTSDPLACGPVGSNQTCRNFKITGCQGVSNATSGTGTVRVGPATGSPQKGAILLLQGGAGTTWWEDFGTWAQGAIAGLRAAGYVTVQVKWNDNGWLAAAPGEASGQERLACRPATVANQINAQYVAPVFGAVLCGTGNSAGASALTYMLTSYGLKQQLAAVVLTGGPPFSRMDWGCLDNNPGYEYTLENRNTVDHGYGFYTAAPDPCVANNTPYEDDFQQNSHVIEDSNDDYLYQSTFVGFLFGVNDTGSSPDHGQLFYDLLVSKGNPHLSPNPGLPESLIQNTNHNVPASQNGATAVKNMLLAQCHPQ